jgi:hypothetical protein
MGYSTHCLLDMHLPRRLGSPIKETAFNTPGFIGASKGNSAQGRVVWDTMALADGLRGHIN